MEETPITLFFRNDDPDVFELGDKRDQLYKLTELFMEKSIPLTQAVVPKTVTDKSIQFFQDICKDTNLLEFIQHGWKHYRYQSGEFDSSRSYAEQKRDIKNGKDYMVDIFGKNLFNAFTAPFGIYTKDTFEILDSENFSVISSAIKFDYKNRLFNKIGRFFKKRILFDKRVSYHNDTIPKSNLKEISISINIMKKKLPSEMQNRLKIIEAIESISKFTNNIGILIHHINLRKEHFRILNRLLDELISMDYKFSKISTIYERIK